MSMLLFRVELLVQQLERLHLWLEHKMNNFMKNVNLSFKVWVKTFLIVGKQVQAKLLNFVITWLLR